MSWCLITARVEPTRIRLSQEVGSVAPPAPNAEPPVRFPKLTYLRIRTVLAPPSGTIVPDFLGATLRGAMGHALLDMVCRIPEEKRHQTPCESCVFRGACVYGRLARRPIEGPVPPRYKGNDKPPRPYVLDVPPPLTTDGMLRDVSGGIAVQVTLFGDVVGAAAYVTKALATAASAGLGSRRTPYSVLEQSWQRTDGTWDAIDTEAPLPERLSHFVQHLTYEVEAARALRLHLMTPTLITRLGHHAEDAWPWELALSSICRVHELAHFYEPGSHIDWDWSALKHNALTTELRVNKTEIWKGRKLSGSQKQFIPLEGLVGTLDLHDVTPDVFAYLRAAEVVHLGKKASHGLGRVRVEPL